jgi:hypothetical protein
MQDVTAAFAAAIAATNQIPIILVELPDCARLFATREFPGRAWLCGEPTTGPDIICGGDSGPYQALIAEGGLSQLSVELDLQSNTTRRSNLTVTLVNQGGLGQYLRATKILDSTPVNVLLVFDGLDYTDALLLLRGVVDNYSISWDAFTLQVLDNSFTAHRHLSVPIGGAYFPGTPRDERGQAIPILIGRQQNVQAIQVVGEAFGSLAFAIGTGDTEILLAELDAPFPPTGTISIGTETGVTYTARDFVILLGVTYLRLSGLTRPAPASQTSKAAVELTDIVYTYLVGYEVGNVTEVRENGIIVDPAEYTVTLAGSGADRDVTTITFDVARTGMITVDADGANVAVEAGFTNGGFETGDLSDWTPGTGMTATVTSGQAFEGTYKAELTGGLDTDRDLYTEFTTVVGRFYTVEFYYKDTIGDTSVLTNGSFEDGVLTPWVDVALGAQPSYAAVVANPSHYDNYCLKFMQTYVARSGFWHAAYQDFPTVIGAAYSLSFDAASGQYFQRDPSTAWLLQGVGSSSLPTSSVSLPIANVNYAYATMSYTVFDVGTMAVLAAGSFPRIQSAGYIGRSFWKNFGPRTFTATGTTTRLRIEGLMTQYGTPLPFPIYVDNVIVTQTTELPTTTTSYALGTPADDDLYAAGVLDHQYGWLRVTLTFQAESTTTRLTIRSRYSQSACATWLDGVRLHDGGRNPAEAIAYVIDTFLPEMTRDTESFDTAYQALLGWQFGAYLPDPGESKDLLERMAYQCKSRFLLSASGEAKLVVYDPFAETVASLTEEDVVEDSMTLERQSLDLVYTEFHVWYGLKTGASPNSAESFQAEVYATAEATTHPTAFLTERCSFASARYRRTHRLDVYADMIRDIDTAHRLLEHLVNTQTQRQDVITLRTWYAMSHLELGDMVLLTHRLLDPNGAVACQVLGVRDDFGNGEVELVLQTVRSAGYYEPWEPLVTTTAVTIHTEPWES